MVFTIRDANNIIPTTISATNKLVYVLHGGCDDGTSEIEAIDVSRRKYNYELCWCNPMLFNSRPV